EGKPLYIGKNKNIRKRVIQHFTDDLEFARFRELKDLVHDITFEFTGSELVASILESNEIRKFLPPYNQALRTKNYRLGIYHFKDEQGFENLHIEPLKPEERPIIEFT